MRGTTQTRPVVATLYANSAAGHGEFKPILPNDTPENRDVNRRVELYVNTFEDDARITSDDLSWR